MPAYSFACAEHRLIIEADSKYYHSRVKTLPIKPVRMQFEDPMRKKVFEASVWFLSASYSSVLSLDRHHMELTYG